jgi:hypothetical protein
MSGYSYITLSGPEGTIGVNATGLNDAGTIIGSFTDGNDVLGLIYDPANGAYTTLSGPVDANSIYDVDVTAINASGTAIGYFEDRSGGEAGFIYDPTTQVYTTINGPDDTSIAVSGGAPLDASVRPIAINASGEVLVSYEFNVGSAAVPYFIDRSAIYNPNSHSYTVLADTFSTAGFQNVEVISTGLNDSGDAVGYFLGVLQTGSTAPLGGFIYDSATSSYTLLSPTGSEAADYTEPAGINDSGEVTGSYVAQGLYGPSYLGAFTYNPAGTGTFTSLAAAGYEVVPAGINASGDVLVTLASDSAYEFYPAVYNPDGTYTTLSPPGSGVAAYPAAINDTGDVIINAPYATVPGSPFGNPEAYAAEPLCFLRGTKILTPTGEVAVEALRIGDLVVTRFSGIQPVKWIGRQSYAARFVRNNQDKMPVRIHAHALGEKFPARDLYVSPGHSMLIGGSLILARCLVNGITITQGPLPAEIDYFNIELGSHDCVIAEGAFAETFADGPGLRAQFHNAVEYFAQYPHSRPPAEIRLCAPRPERGAELDAALRPVVARAAGGVAPGPLEGCIDIVTEWRVEGWALDMHNPELPVLLEFVVDGKVIGTALACDFRDDLKAAGKGNGRCAVFHKLPVRLPGALLPQLYIRRAADGAQIRARHDPAAGQETRRPADSRAVA